MTTVYILSEHNKLTYLETIDDKDIRTWLENDGMDHLSLRIVNDNGHYSDMLLTDRLEWDVFHRGVDTLLNEGKTKFKDFSKKQKAINKDKPLDQKSHMMKAARGLDRKRQSYVPLYKQMAHQDALPTAENVLKNAKKASSGAWKLSKRQIMEIASKYKFNIPTEAKRTKHLGSTGILMWRKTAKDYYLVKFSKHHKKRN